MSGERLRPDQTSSLLLAALLPVLLLVLFAGWIITLTEEVFTLFGRGFSWKDIILIVGGLFVAEALTSQIQDKIGIRWLGRRIFYRAPLHHSMQYRGIAETKVVIRLWIISGICARLTTPGSKGRRPPLLRTSATV